MEENYSNPHFPRLRRVAQITNAHCGPATIQMLLSYQGVFTDQVKIAAAANINHKIKDYGMTVTEMAIAVSRLVPEVCFWYKNESKTSDLEELILVHQYPVGVEWRGMFEQYWDGDDGHYSVVTHIDRRLDLIMISDPYEPFSKIDRRIKLSEFEKLWWDINVTRDAATGYMKEELDYHTIFIITPAGVGFPELMGMQRL
jgi:hypothetical protein